MGGRNSRNTAAKRIALGGVLSALALVLMLLGGYIPIGTFAAPIFASLCFLPVSIELSPKWALLCYVAVSLLSVLVVPDLELLLFFILLLGYYPVLQSYLNRIKLQPLRWLVKLLIFNAAVAGVYCLLLIVFASPTLIAEFTGQAWWFLALLWGAGNIIFILYDILLDKARIIYITRLRRHLFK